MEYKNSFVLYESVFKHFERLQKRDKELALEYINAIMNYGLYGEVPAEDSEIWDFGIDSDIASISTAKKKFSKKINIPKEELQEHLNKGLKQTEMGLELSPKLTQNQSFMKISYISYTKAQEALYLLTISGEGLGVG